MLQDLGPSHSESSGSLLPTRRSSVPTMTVTGARQPAYVPRHKQLLLNPSLSQQKSLHVESNSAQNGFSPSSRNLNKKRISQPILAYSSNPDVKPESSLTATSDSSKRGSTSVKDSRSAPTSQKGAMTTAIKRKAVPKYEIATDNAPSSAKEMPPLALPSAMSEDDYAKMLQRRVAEDQLVGNILKPAGKGQRKHSASFLGSDKVRGLGLEMGAIAPSGMTSSPDKVDTRSASVDQWPAPPSRDRRSGDLMSHDDNQLLTVLGQGVTLNMIPRARSVQASSEFFGTKNIPKSISKSSQTRFTSLLPRDRSANDTTADEHEQHTQLEAWMASMGGVEAERRRNRLEAQSRRGSIFLDDHGADPFSSRRLSMSSTSRSSSFGGDSSSPGSSLSSAFTFESPQYLNDSSLSGVSRQSKSSRLSGFPHSWSRGDRSVSSGASPFPSRRFEDRRRISSIALKSQLAGTGTGEDTLIDLWVELMGGEVQDEPKATPLPFPSRKQGSSGANRTDTLCIDESATEYYGADRILPMYHALPPLKYASISSSAQSSVPALSEAGDSCESDAETNSEDWASARSHPRSSFDSERSVLAFDDGHSASYGFHHFSWSNSVTKTSLASQVEENAMSPRTPNLSLASVSTAATPALSCTPTLHVGPLCVSIPSSEPTTSESGEEDLSDMVAPPLSLAFKRSSTPLVISPPPRPIKSTRRISRGDNCQAMVAQQPLLQAS